jgi:excisionase family DNA binding protein
MVPLGTLCGVMSIRVEPHYVSVSQAATILGLAPNTVRARIDAGDLPARKFGPHEHSPIRIHLDDLDTFAAAHDLEPKEPE